jgi:mono/diheme cytochrome c family protein
MPQHARVLGANRQGRRHVFVRLRLDVAQPHHLSRASRELAQAVFEVGNRIRLALGRCRRHRLQRRTVGLPERRAPLALPRAVERQVAADAEHEAPEALGLIDTTFAQRLDHQQEHILCEFFDSVGSAQPAAGEGSHGGGEADAQRGFGLALTPSRAAHQVGGGFGRCLTHPRRLAPAQFGPLFELIQKLRGRVTLRGHAPLRRAHMTSTFWKRRSARVGAVVLGTLGIFGGVTYARATRTVDAPYPNIHASSDPAVVERGRYLVEGAAHCGECHGAVDPPSVTRLGRPLSGGMEFHLPVGTFRVPNITSDSETGIGGLKDEELARMIRYGVKPNGQTALPFMPYADLSDDDLTAIISYLRTQKPVKHAVPEHDVNPLGRIVQAYVLAPKGPSQPPRKSVPPEPTAAYGQYITHNIANCVMCHTKVDMRTGAFAGPLFGGGAEHEAFNDPSKKYVSPNLTPDPRWGWLQGWSEEAFIARFHAGRVHADSPMPWERFQTMTDADLRAIYRYLKSLPPAQTGPDPRNHQVVLTASNP